jgi:adenine-specific DNA-methyltransferase
MPILGCEEPNVPRAGVNSVTKREVQGALWMPEIASSFDPRANVVVAPGESLDALKQVPDGQIKLIITSPPYNIGKPYEKATDLARYVDDLRPIIGELIRVLAPDGSVCWQVGNYVNNSEIVPLDTVFYPVFANLGLKLRNRIVWHFEHGLHASKRFSGRYETLLWFTKGDTYTFNLDDVRVPSKYPGKLSWKGPNKGQPTGNPLGKNPSDVWKLIANEWEVGFWDIPNVKSNHAEKTIHPCQFPIELVERCVLALTQLGDWVLDPFSGVGSALLAALRHDRRAMGCEREPEYVKIAHERIVQLFNGTLGYRPLGRPKHVPTGREKVSQVPPEWLERDRA